MSRFAAFASTALLSLASVASAAEADAPKSPQAKPAATSSHQSGVRVYVDPQTHRRTTQPSPEARRAAADAAASNPAFNHSSEGLVERPLPNGGYIVDLEGRFQSAVGVRIGKDGKREFYCDEPGHTPAAPTGREER